ncbi:Hypothetical predicted protein [Mytilus galloprovincialis]|uniref:Mab-21-like nucleotidyltransferase domain-containing protein n=1 Tax=Mytilus galloprovincialis TaxID=29158 RepID=A0A8B6EA41_MYTGA|nr:Hypothetical predicted protein [Mytilus galloprovincialis]
MTSNERVTLKSFVKCTDGQSRPTKYQNLKERQQKYCEYISLFLSHFGQERCMLAGSTEENTRLRLKGDEGDFDYLIISEISIPIECLEYRKNLPCFVYINGIEKSKNNLFAEESLLIDTLRCLKYKLSKQLDFTQRTFPLKMASKSVFRIPKLNNESHMIEKVRGNDEDDQVIIQYKYKTSKDFIPVVSLNGKPKFLDEWLNRKRKWPPTDFVTDIYDSEFFVVAKPSLVEPSKKDIDFCLACNIGEIKLAEAMTQLQKNVILIIKA